MDSANILAYHQQMTGFAQQPYGFCSFNNQKTFLIFVLGRSKEESNEKMYKAYKKMYEIYLKEALKSPVNMSFIQPPLAPKFLQYYDPYNNHQSQNALVPIDYYQKSLN
ncbi:unnamed protein product [Brachionus calyciflorus]|uniref:Uncharacterized protein n=1 Tax=Brachionus calyciflorus TaxID=104777 RepID=A0A813MGJ0_9BILA|nr:unnamed protein product [Brachionus calyciflorus]